MGLPAEKAELLAGLLTTNDLRGIFSHGTQQIATYAILMRDKKLNNDPQITTVKETPVSVLVDGDGGLGYFPAYEGTQQALVGRGDGYRCDDEPQPRPLRCRRDLRAASG